MAQAIPLRHILLLFVSSLCTLDTYAQFTPELSAYNADIEYGVIANENGICRMNDRGFLIGLNGQSCLGSGSRAIFDVRAWAGAVIQIDTIGSSIPGLVFTPRLVGSHTQVMPASGKTYIIVVGDLALMNAQSGSHSLNYLLSVNYE